MYDVFRYPSVMKNIIKLSIQHILIMKLNYSYNKGCFKYTFVTQLSKLSISYLIMIRNYINY